MQFEVVLRLKGLLADLTLEPSSNAVSGQMASEVSLTRENLRVVGKRADEGGNLESVQLCRCGLYLLTVWTRKAVGGSQQMFLQGFLS